MVEADRAPNTHRSYAERLKRHVLPALGHLKLRLIHRAHIKTFLAEKRRQGHSKNGVRLMKAPLSALLSEAVDDGIIPVNPALQLGRRLGPRLQGSLGPTSRRATSARSRGRAGWRRSEER